MISRYLELHSELLRRVDAMPEGEITGPVKIVYRDTDLKFTTIQPGQVFSGKFIVFSRNREAEK